MFEIGGDCKHWVDWWVGRLTVYIQLMVYQAYQVYQDALACALVLYKRITCIVSCHYAPF